MKSAVIVGASSGIGKELAKVLASHGYILGLVARREELLFNLQRELPGKSYVKALDVRNVDHTRRGFQELIAEMGDVDLVVISAGIGYINPELNLDEELSTIATNVVGFTVAANLAFRYFLSRGAGHLVGISSIAGIRGSAEAPAYNASKAFLTNYLQGLTQKAVKSGLPITVTDIQPGFVDTEMAKGDGLFWVAPVRKAAEQIYHAIEKKKSHAYITRRWRLIGWLLRSLPDFIYNRL